MKKNANSVFPKLLLLGVAILILLRLVIYRNYLLGRELYFFSDDAIYATLAKRFLAGDFWHAFHPYWSPGFPIASIPFYLLSGSWETSQFLVSVFSATSLIFVLFWFFKRYSLFLAFTIAFITGFSISLQQLVTSGGITEPLYLLLLWLGISSSWLALETSQKRFYISSGIFFGLAYLTRTEVMVIVILFIIISCGSSVFQWRSRFSRNVLVNKISVVFAVFAVISYLYLPVTKLTHFTTFSFSIFNSANEIVFALTFLLLALAGLLIKRNKVHLLLALKQIIPRAGVFLVSFFLINMPYITFQSLQLGRFTLSGKYAFIGTGPYFALEEDRMTTLAQDIWSTDYIDYSSPYFNPQRASDYVIKGIKTKALTQNAQKLFLESLHLFKSVNNSNFFVGIGLYMAFAGFIFGVSNKKFRMLTLYLSYFWLIMLIWVSFFMSSTVRYLAYALPFFFYLQALSVYAAGLLLSTISNAVTSPKNFPFVKNLSITLVFLLFAGYFFSKNVGSIDPFISKQASGGNYKEQKILAEWIKSQGMDVIGGHVEATGFYANAKLVYMPSSPPKDIVRYMKAWGVEYLLVRPQEVGYDFVAPIANSKFKHPDLTLFKKFDDGSLIWHIRLTDKEKKDNLRLTRERKLVHDDK